MFQKIDKFYNSFLSVKKQIYHSFSKYVMLFSGVVSFRSCNISNCFRLWLIKLVSWWKRSLLYYRNVPTWKTFELCCKFFLSQMTRHILNFFSLSYNENEGWKDAEIKPVHVRKDITCYISKLNLLIHLRLTKKRVIRNRKIGSHTSGRKSYENIHLICLFQHINKCWAEIRYTVCIATDRKTHLDLVFHVKIIFAKLYESCSTMLSYNSE